jgi:hypothetical protein
VARNKYLDDHIVAPGLRERGLTRAALSLSGKLILLEVSLSSAHYLERVLRTVPIELNPGEIVEIVSGNTGTHTKADKAEL